MILAAALLSGVVLMPPKKYDYEPRVPYVVVFMEPSQIRAVCNRYTGPEPYACTSLVSRPFRIRIRTDLSKRLLRDVLRHEKAHVNGWRHAD